MEQTDRGIHCVCGSISGVFPLGITHPRGAEISFRRARGYYTVLGLLLISLLYICLFFAIGMFISTYLDNSKTALIVAFTFWVFAVLVAPRGAFAIAKLVAPTQTQQAVYMEKTALRNT